jgi:xanthine dehydrogenase accessory factor
MMTTELARRAEALAADRSPYVAATVVRASRPTSVAPGDSALVLADGAIEGFVGGECAEASVRLHAARALETGEPVLLRITPGDDDAPAVEGAVTVRNPCLSGGALEIFLEPRLPAPVGVVIGAGPIAGALRELLGWLRWEVAGTIGAVPDAAAVVVAAHGGDEEAPLRAALEAGVPYVALVASRRRGAATVAALRDGGVEADALARLHTPAGLDLGARGPHEVAVSVVAEIVATRHAAERLAAPAPTETGSADREFARPRARPTARPSRTPRRVAPWGDSPAEALDPVCGMTVPVGPSTLHLDHDGRRVYFCGEGCRRAFAADPTAHHAAPR